MIHSGEESAIKLGVLKEHIEYIESRLSSIKYQDKVILMKNIPYPYYDVVKIIMKSWGWELIYWTEKTQALQLIPQRKKFLGIF